MCLLERLDRLNCRVIGLDACLSFLQRLEYVPEIGRLTSFLSSKCMDICIYTRDNISGSAYKTVGDFSGVLGFRNFSDLVNEIEQFCIERAHLKQPG